MARRGVLIKGGRLMELTGKLDTLLVDKTGTFTLGRPKVVEVIPGPGYREEDVVLLAATGEKFSEHPLPEPSSMPPVPENFVPDPDEFKSEPGWVSQHGRVLTT